MTITSILCTAHKDSISSSPSPHIATVLIELGLYRPIISLEKNAWPIKYIPKRFDLVWITIITVSSHSRRRSCTSRERTERAKERAPRLLDRHLSAQKRRADDRAASAASAVACEQCRRRRCSIPRCCLGHRGFPQSPRPSHRRQLPCRQLPCRPCQRCQRCQRWRCRCQQ